MIDNNQMFCDNCSDPGPREDDFWSTKYKADEEGWLTVKVCGEWFNYCTTCRGEFEDG